MCAPPLPVAHMMAAGGGLDASFPLPRDVKMPDVSAAYVVCYASLVSNTPCVVELCGGGMVIWYIGSLQRIIT